MATFYLKSGAGAADFNAAHTYSTGDKIVPARGDVSANVAVAKKWVWECTTGGTTNGAASWGASVTQDVTTMTQNGVVFTARKPGFSSGTTANWAFSAIYADYVTTAVAAGDTVYVSNNHAESISVAGQVQLFTSNVGTLTAPCKLICANDSAAPPTATATTATFTNTNGTGGWLIGSGFYHLYGCTWTCGSGASGTASFGLGGGAAGWMIVENCSIVLASTGASSQIGTGSNTDAIFRNCTFKFGATGNNISCGHKLMIEGGSFLSGTSSPTTLLANAGTQVWIQDFDFSNLGASFNFSAFTSSGPDVRVNIRNCQSPASWSGSLSSGAAADQTRYEAVNLGNSSANYKLHVEDWIGTIDDETTIVRSGGASDGTTPFSHKMVSNGNAAFPSHYLLSQELPCWVDSTGSSKTATVEFIHDSATGLKDTEIWVEVHALTTSTAPLGSITSSRADLLASGSTCTSSSVTWNGTGGMTNPNKQNVSVSITPQLKGLFYARVCIAKASYTVYVDPLVTVT